jgi:hypothetical protein
LRGLNLGTDTDRVEAIDTELKAVVIGLLEAYSLLEIIAALSRRLGACRRLNREIMD